MAKKKKPPVRKEPSSSSFTTFKQEFSFDTDAIILMSLLEYTIRKEVEQTAVAISEDKMCIPKATILKAIKQLGLGDWIPKILDEE